MAKRSLVPRNANDWKRLGLAGVVAACLVGIGWAFSMNSDAPARLLPAAIERVDPLPNSPAVPRQSTVSADLVFGQTGVLVIDGREIPLDQLDIIRAQSIVSFTPGPGRELSRLRGGSQVATVIYWPETGTREANAQEFAWRFTVN